MIWSELITDLLLIDKIQTYGSCKYADIIACLSTRSILMLIGVYFVYFVGCTIDSKHFGLFAFTGVIAIETLYLCIRKRGVEFKLFVNFITEILIDF